MFGYEGGLYLLIDPAPTDTGIKIDIPKDERLALVVTPLNHPHAIESMRLCYFNADTEVEPL